MASVTSLRFASRLLIKKRPNHKLSERTNAYHTGLRGRYIKKTHWEGQLKSITYTEMSIIRSLILTRKFIKRFPIAYALSGDTGMRNTLNKNAISMKTSLVKKIGKTEWKHVALGLVWDG